MIVPPDIDIEEPEDRYDYVLGPSQVQALVNIMGIVARKWGGQIDVTSEEIAGISGCSCNISYNAKTGALRLLLKDPDDKVWNKANVNYAGHA